MDSNGVVWKCGCQVVFQGEDFSFDHNLYGLSVKTCKAHKSSPRELDYQSIRRFAREVGLRLADSSLVLSHQWYVRYELNTLPSHIGFYHPLLKEGSLREANEAFREWWGDPGEPRFECSPDIYSTERLRVRYGVYSNDS